MPQELARQAVRQTQVIKDVSCWLEIMSTEKVAPHVFSSGLHLVAVVALKVGLFSAGRKWLHAAGSLEGKLSFLSVCSSV